MIPMDFSKRLKESEGMDDPTLDAQLLKQVFRDIQRSNRLLGGDRVLRQALNTLRKYRSKSEYTLLDLGCGDGTQLRKIVYDLKAMDIEVRAVGVDLSPVAIGLAKEASRAFPEITYVQADIRHLDTERFRSDWVLCSLTLHHLTDGDIPPFLKSVMQLARIGVVINDLHRSRLAYYLFQVFSAIFIRTATAKADGSISIRSGFTKAELDAFAKSLPGIRHSIRWKWAFRYIWIMTRHPIDE